MVSMEQIKAAAIQLSPGEDMDRNAQTALDLVRDAAKEGARLIALPEYFAYYGAEERWAEAGAMTSRVVSAFRQEAKNLDVYILMGTVLVPGSDSPGKLANTSILLDPDGEHAAQYIKRHLFDVSLDSGEFCESQWLERGKSFATADVEGWKLGLSICFDLRFPHHFAALRGMDANVIAVPSAFSLETGAAHWMPLIRARAIETQCYVIAPALVGECGAGKKCFGSTAIIDPWGQVAALKEHGEGFVMALLDPSFVERVRRKIPMTPSPHPSSYPEGDK
ncbi:MAG: carbon-nitrogen hydrolase family protein [Nitrospinota bacterium]|nr:carbon-nitrogen hydrolase family protein [Nitrospinota bacterium]